MADKKDKKDALVKSPFKTIDTSHSFPAIRPDDGRLTRIPEQLKQYEWKKGMPSPNPMGRPKTKHISDFLRKKLEEMAVEEGIPYYEMVGNVIMKGCLGSVKLTPSQLGCLQVLLNYTEGKPAVQDSSSGGNRAIIFDIENVIAVNNTEKLIEE
jgi:hypothetical protein